MIVGEIPVNPRTPIPLFARGKRRAPGPSGGDPAWPAEIPVDVARRKTRSGYAQAAAQQLERMMRLLHRDEAKLHRRSFAKKAAASLDLPLFPQNPILFSESAELVTLHGREARLALGPIGAGRATQVRSAVSVKSRSRATAPTVLPSSKTRRTAWTLKS